MYYVVESDKSFDQAAVDLEAAVARNGFGVLHVHDLGSTLRGKGVEFAEQCKVFEVCNPQQAAKVLATDMRLNMALPCRISVFTGHLENLTPKNRNLLLDFRHSIRVHAHLAPPMLSGY